MSYRFVSYRFRKEELFSTDAAVGGPLAIVKENDPISIDIPLRRLDLDVPAEEIKRRLENWTPPPPKADRGILGLCAKTALQADVGAILDDRLS